MAESYRYPSGTLVLDRRLIGEDGPPAGATWAFRLSTGRPEAASVTSHTDTTQHMSPAPVVGVLVGGGDAVQLTYVDSRAGGSECAVAAPAVRPTQGVQGQPADQPARGAEGRPARACWVPDATVGRGRARRESASDRMMRTIYRLHVPPLLQYLMRLTNGNRQAAEDLLQETLLRAWRNIDRLTAAPDSVRPWLFTVARNHAIDVIRARQARPTEVGMIDAAWVPAPGDAVEQLLTATAVRQALEELSPEHRAVIVELYLRGATLVETAARVGIPVGTVKSRAHYALRALRAAIGSMNA